MPNNGKENQDVIDNKPESSSNLPEVQPDPEVLPTPRPLPIQLNQDFSILNNLIEDTTIVTPVSNDINEDTLSQSKESLSSTPSDDIPPKVHPRRRSSVKVNEKRSSITGQPQRSSIPNQENIEANETLPTLSSSRSESMLVDSEQKISVKERKQMFNRMASESDVLKSNKVGGNFNSHVSTYEDFLVDILNKLQSNKHNVS